MTARAALNLTYAALVDGVGAEGRASIDEALLDPAERELEERRRRLALAGLGQA